VHVDEMVEFDDQTSVQFGYNRCQGVTLVWAGAVSVTVTVVAGRTVVVISATAASESLSAFLPTCGDS